MTAEYAIEYKRSDGSTFVGAPCSEQHARSMVADSAGYEPRPVRVVTREWGAWRAVER